MPPPAAAPASGGGLNLKKLPPWAWGVAIAGGAVVGFVLLKPGKPDPEETDAESDDMTAVPRGEGGSGGAIPALDENMLSALGLTSTFTSPSYSSAESGAGESAESGFTDAGLGPVGPTGSQLTPAQSTPQTSLGGPTYNAPSTTSSAGALGAGPTAGGTPAAGGGSSLFKAQ